MRQRDRDPLVDSDPHGLLFDPSDDHDADDHGPDGSGAPRQGPRPQQGPAPTRRSRHARAAARSRRRWGRRIAVVLGLLLVAVLAIGVWFVVLPVYRYFEPSDYSGAGTGSVIVTVAADDDATQIGQTLHDDGVVASVRAFTDAATRNSRSEGIQPGSYRLHAHMSATSALHLLLEPSSRVRSDVAVPEGATTFDIAQRLTAKPCGAKAASSALCGPGLDAAAVRQALAHVHALGLPTDYTVGGRPPTSVEGFLFPATYALPPSSKPSDALQQMITKFTDEARGSDFTASARAEHLTPYQALIVASIAQSEAKFPADFGRVARVVLNRLAAHQPLKIDAVSRYGARLQGLDPAKVTYSQVPGPYNTYTHAGLPPTPISNPGNQAMNGAAHPTAGNWLFYVNDDSAGHLFFTNSEAAFETAAARCRANHWGCG